MINDALLVASNDNKPTCKGLFYRCSIHNFIDKSGALVSSTKLRPLKRMSCKGCEKCAGILDTLAEDLSCELPSKLAHGDVVELGVVIDSEDCESGLSDGWHVRAQLVENL